MIVDDKLPPIASAVTSVSPSTAPGTVPVVFNRSRGSANSCFPPASGHRVDSSHASHSRRGHFPRRTTSRTPTSFRSSTASHSLVSMILRHTSHDTDKYLVTAAAKARAIMEKFVAQLQTYQTYNPILVKGGVYSTQEIESGISDSAAWSTVDRALDASSSYTVRHHADGGFIATLEAIPSVQENISFSEFEYKPRSTEIELQDDISSVFNDKHSASFDLWRREHPAATKEEVRSGLMFWDMERAKYERLGRQGMRRQLEAEHDELSEYSIENTSAPLSSVTSRAKTPVGKPVWLAEEQIKQREHWEIFHSVRRTFKRSATIVSPTAAPIGGSTLAAKIINDYSRGDELHEWLEFDWRNHTDRHEDAALRIQCAYRSYLAKLEASWKRYRRQLVFLEALRVEEKFRHSWNTASRVVTDELHGVYSNFDSSLRSVNFVYSKLYATAIRRRAQKKAEEERLHEVQDYAALTIQRVYRGHCGRQDAKAVRYPELFRSRHWRRREAASIVLQAAWRGYRARVLLQRQLKAVLVIQRLVRLSSSRRKLRELRGAKCRDVERSTREFAIKIIMRLLKNCVLRRREYMMERWPQVQTLRRVARGYLARLALRRRKHHVYVLSKALQVALWGQRHFRGACGRTLAGWEREKREALLYERRCIDATIVIQRSWRTSSTFITKGMNNRTENITDAPNALNHISEPIPEHIAVPACIIIQRWYRSMKIVRKAMDELSAKRKLLLTQDAAERILRFYRGYKSLQHPLPSLRKS